MRKLFSTMAVLVMVCVAVVGFTCPGNAARINPEPAQDDVLISLGFIYELQFDIVEEELIYDLSYEEIMAEPMVVKTFNSVTHYADATSPPLTLSYFASGYHPEGGIGWQILTTTGAVTLASTGSDPGFISTPVLIDTIAPVSTASPLIGQGILPTTEGDITCEHVLTVDFGMWTSGGSMSSEIRPYGGVSLLVVVVE